MENIVDSTMTPTIQNVSEVIKSIIQTSIKSVEEENNLKIVTSHIENGNNSDSWSMSISFALADEPMVDKTLNFAMVQNTKTRDISIVITTGEKEGLKILYKTITKYPINSIEKYLPNIIFSSINILAKNMV